MLSICAARRLDLAWVTVPEASPLSGKSQRELDMRRQMGVSVVGVVREGDLNTNPPGSYRFAAGDAVAVIGDNDRIAALQELAEPGPRTEAAAGRAGMPLSGWSQKVTAQPAGANT